MTLSEPGVSMRALCEELGPRVGLRLDVSSELNNTPVVLRVKDLPAQEVLAKIADTLTATWEGTGARSYRLVRTRADRDRLFERHLKYRAARFSAEVDQYVEKAKPREAVGKEAFTELLEQLKALQQAGVPANPWESQKALNAFAARTPTGRALARLLLAVDPRRVAQIPVESLLAFSNQPTREQSPFAVDISGVIADLNREQDLYEEARAGVGVVEGDSGISTKPIVKVLLEVRRGDALSEAAIYFTAWDASGDLVLPLKMLPLEAPAEARTPVDAPDLHFQLAPQAARFAKLLSDSLYGSKEPIELTEGQRGVLMDPVKNDPLSLASGPTLLACAEALNRNLIAVLRDPQIFIGVSSASSTLVAPFIQANEMGPEWITKTPPDLYESELTNLPRDLMAAYIQGSMKTEAGDFSLDQWLYSRYPFHLYSSPLPRYSPLLRFSIGFGGDVKALRFYGSLGDGQKAKMAGSKLEMADLSPEQTQKLSDWILRDAWSYCLLPATGYLHTNLPEHLWQIPSERFASGLSNCWVSAESKSETVVRGRTAGDVVILSATELGSYMSTSRRPAAAPIDHFMVGVRRTTTMTFTDGLVKKEAMFSRNEVDPKAPLVGFDDLPESFREAAMRQKAQMDATQPYRPPVQTPPPARQ